MTYGAERIALLRRPLPRGHTELSARTWTSVTPLPVTHLLGYQSGTGRLDTAAPARPGSPSAGDGHELPRLPSGANFMSRLHPQSWNRSHSLGNGDGQRPTLGHIRRFLMTCLAIRSDAVALSLITAGERGAGA
jgi:hypothetical protein